MKIKDAMLSDPRLLLIYGPGGCGKTALVSQLKNAYLMDFDRGLLTCKTLKDKFSHLRGDVDFDTFYNESITEANAWPLAKQKLISIQSRFNNSSTPPYNGIIIDSLTGMCKVIVKHVMLEKTGDANGIPRIQHYNDIINELETALTIARSLNCIVILTAHENLVDTDEGTLIRIASATRSHGNNQIPWLFDEVLYMCKKNRGQGKIDYIVTGRPSNVYFTKTRSGIEDDIIINDTGLEGLLEKMSFKYPSKAPSSEKGTT